MRTLAALSVSGQRPAGVKVTSVVRPTLSGQRPAKVKVTGVHRVVRPTTPSPPTLGVVSRVQYIELSADMSLGYGNGSDSPHRTRLKTCRSARVMVATARIANITCRILSFRCGKFFGRQIKLTHVGFRAHVKVASRIVRRSVDQLTCRSATEMIATARIAHISRRNVDQLTCRSATEMIATARIAHISRRNVDQLTCRSAMEWR